MGIGVTVGGVLFFTDVLSFMQPERSSIMVTILTMVAAAASTVVLSRVVRRWEDAKDRMDRMREQRLHDPHVFRHRPR